MRLDGVAEVGRKVARVWRQELERAFKREEARARSLVSGGGNGDAVAGRIPARQREGMAGRIRQQGRRQRRAPQQRAARVRVEDGQDAVILENGDLRAVGRDDDAADVLASEQNRLVPSIQPDATHLPRVRHHEARARHPYP